MKSKPNITVADIGKYYTSDGNDVWQLEDFKTEPQVRMVSYLDRRLWEGNLSEFKDVIRLLPETEPVKARKTRKDKKTLEDILNPDK